jgi:hypothetical protein
VFKVTLTNIFPGGSSEQLDALVDKLGLKQGLPSGMQFFQAGMASAGPSIVVYWKDSSFLGYDSWIGRKYQPVYREVGLAEPTFGTFRPTYSFGLPE